MAFKEHAIYHIYNRSINKEVLFHSDEDYIKFIQMTRKHLSETCDILCWCLMPNHFHFLVYTMAKSIESKKVGGLQLQSIQNGIKNLLSSYSKSYNYLHKRTGNLFQQKTKAKEVINDGRTVFHYIHQNAWKAKLVSKPEDWKYSSLKDFLKIRNGTLCNRELAFELLDIDPATIYDETCRSVSNDLIKKLDLLD